MLFSRSLPAVLLLASIPFLSGCFGIQIRELKTEKQMLQARVMQLQQDIGAHQERDDNQKKRIGELGNELAVRDTRIAGLEDELKTTRKQLADTRQNLASVQSSQTKEIVERLNASLELETQLRRELEGLRVRAASLEAQLAQAQEEHQALDQELLLSKSEIESRNKLIQEMSTTLGEQQAEVNALRDKERTVAQKTADLDADLAQRAAELEKAQEFLLERDARIAALEAASAKWKAEIESVRGQLAATRQEKAARETELAAVAQKLAPAVTPAQVQDVRHAAELYLANAIKNGEAEVIAEDAEIRLVLFSDAMFRSGTTILSRQGLEALSAAEKLANEIGPARIRVEGHTDDLPVRNMPYPDNWELAGARAAEVVRWLAARPNFNPANIVAQSHAWYKPLHASHSAATRKKNRRVEVVMELRPRA